MKLKVGDIPPNFIASDAFGKEVSLSDYESKAVLLVFLRYAGCPWCNLALHRLTMEYSLLKRAKCELVAFIESSPKNIQKNIYERHSLKPEFHIIPEPNRKIYKQYGVDPSIKSIPKMIKNIPYWVHAVKKHGFKQAELDGNLFLVPAFFLLGHDGRIKQLNYSADLFEHEAFENIYAALNSDQY
ncbi:MAG: redoxin domain-containing protein [bacterium]|nr:redoxin domain-containing protein [bacterium]